MKSVSDSDLIRNLQAGDEPSFRYLVDKYHVVVVKTCIGFVHSSADAEDIAQDVFIEVFESVMKFRGDSGLSTWIYRIAVNKSLNFLRSVRRRKFVSLFDTFQDSDNARVDEPVSDEKASPENLIISDEQSRAIKSALSSLPEKQKTAFVLSKYDDLSYKEISEIMGLSISSVESLIFRAKSNLQKKLYSFYKKNVS